MIEGIVWWWGHSLLLDFNLQKKMVYVGFQRYWIKQFCQLIKHKCVFYFHFIRISWREADLPVKENREKVKFIMPKKNHDVYVKRYIFLICTYDNFSPSDLYCDISITCCKILHFSYFTLFLHPSRDEENWQFCWLMLLSVHYWCMSK
jgi:hypothetical protein